MVGRRIAGILGLSQSRGAVLKNLSFDKIKAVIDRAPAQMEKVEAKIGWFPSAKYANGTPVAYVAAIQEFGAPEDHIPARPFLRPTIARDKDMWVKQLGRGVKDVLANRVTGHNVFAAIATAGAQGVQKTIASIHAPPLSPITIMLRGMKLADNDLVVTDETVKQARAKVARGEAPPKAPSLKPLVDTGTLIATVEGLAGEPE